MELSEKGLRDRLSSDKLIGCFHISKDVKGFFNDIRGGEGELVEIPGLDDVTIEYQSAELKDGVFYSFLWRVSSDKTHIEVVGTPTPIDYDDFLDTLFNVHIKMKGKALQDSINSQESTFSEVTGSDHTFIYELLQNANDYPYKKEPVKVKFVLSEHYLFFFHTGAEFNLRNIVGICSINQGEKKKNTETIGYKGIGFKTVFVNNDYVFLNTGSWNFRFDKAYSEAAKYGRCAWSMMPIKTKVSELDEEAQRIIMSAGAEFRVRFALRHKTDAGNNLVQIDKVFANDDILLFIPNIAQVDVIAPNRQPLSITKDLNKWIVDSLDYNIPSDLKEWVKESIKNGGKIPPKFNEIDKIRISFAVPKEGRIIKPLDQARVFNYLPTELNIGIGALVNADFVPNGSRNGLHDVIWNDHVMTEVGRKFVIWWASLLSTEDEYDIVSVFSLLPPLTVTGHYAKDFENGFDEAIIEVDCIPAIADGKYGLYKLSDIIVDQTGITAGEDAVFSDDEFYDFTGLSGVLPHKEIRSDQHLLKLFSDYPEQGRLFDYEALRQCLRKQNTKEWLKNKENNLKFLRFLIRKDILHRFTSEELFLTPYGDLLRADQIYLNIDEYLKDLSFLEEKLPYLELEIRKELELEPKWGQYHRIFKSFNPTLFARDLQWSSIKFYLKNPEHNIRMVHFMACYADVYNLPDWYSFVTEAEIIADGQLLFVPNELGRTIKSKPWFKPDELIFISEHYLDNDTDKVARYLLKQGVKQVTSGSFYQLFLQDCRRMHIIASRIKNIDNNRDFFLFLSKIKDYDIRFTPEMRENYVLPCTEDTTECSVTLDSPLYFKDSSWEIARKESWVPAGYCRAMSEHMWDGLTAADKTDLESFLRSKQLVHSFSVAQFAVREVIPHIADVCDVITSKQQSRDFLDYLYVHRTEFIDRNRPNSYFHIIPVYCEGVEDATSRANNRNGIYYHCKDIDELIAQPWCQALDIPILDHFYDTLFDGQDRIQFYEQIGFVRFSLAPFIYRKVLMNSDGLKEVLSDKGNNLSFHSFFADHKQMFTENEMQKLQRFPIFLASNDADGVLDSVSNNHYIPSKDLSEIIKADLVPAGLLDSIHPDYVRSEDDLDYYVRVLDNVSFDIDGFVDYISQDANIKEVSDYLEKDSERNIRFWRWAANAKTDKKHLLRSFPILGHQFNSTDDKYTLASKLSLSNAYLPGQNFESVVNRFNSGSLFVSDKYKESGDDNKKWVSLFKVIGVTSENKDLIFKRIIPSLSELAIKEIVPMIAKYTDEIANAIRNGEDELKGKLSYLKLKCSDGNFRPVTETIITGRFLGIDIMPIPEIEMANFVSEEYLDDSETDGDGTRAIKSFMGVLADTYGNGLETATELRDYKIGFYADNHSYQRELANKDVEAHFRLIGRLADEWYNDRVGVGEKLKGGHQFCVITKSGEQWPSYDTYLGSAYKPDCDFEGNGVNIIGTKDNGYPVYYVSEEYLKYSPHIKEFFTHSPFYIVEGFREEYLPLLSQAVFSRYFWTVYAPSHEYNLEGILTEDNLRNLACIPTINGVKKPSELYDYRVADLKRMAIMLAAPSECTTLPDINLPEWFKDTRIGFRGRLTFSDCISYLKLNKHDYRRRVYEWLADMSDSLSSQQKELVVEYREDALWYNGKKEWVPMKELVALEWGNKTLLNYFSSNESVCNPSYMPEDRYTYNKLCELLSIPVITNDDFKKAKEGNVDQEAILEIGKRLLYVAYKENSKEWEVQYDKYMEFLRSADICSCSTIEYRYNDSIKAKMKSYCEEDDRLWYVGKWNGPLFARILDWLKRVLKLTCETSMLESIFLDDYNEILNSYEESLPDSFIERLSKEDSKGLKASSEEIIAEFNEEYNEDSYVEPHGHELTNDINNEFEEEGDVEEDTAAYSPSRASSSGPSSKGGSHEEMKTKPSGTPATSSKSTATPKPVSKPSAAVDAYTAKTSIEDKLAAYWEEKQSSEVRKPKQAHTAYTDKDEQIIGETAARESVVPHFAKATGASVANNVSNNRTESDLKRKATEATNAAEKAQENYDLLELISETEEYCFLWFKYIMRMMYGESRKSTIREFQVDFLSGEIVDDHSFTLRTPSKPIPGWVGDADYLTVLPLLKGKRKIAASVLLVKEDYLYLTISKDLDIDLQEEFSGVEKFRVNASGSTLSIVDCLETRFIQLGYEDDYNLKENLPSHIHYIYGPPGTGKTTWLTRRIVSLLDESIKPLNILILTPTNKAADVIAEMLLKTDATAWLYRFGTTERESLIEANKVVTRDDEFFNYDEHHIVVTTAARFTYDNISGDDICEMDWDIIIVDEASMIDIVTATFILHKGKCEQFFVAGDPKQIQPVKQNDYQPGNIYNMVGLDSFSEAQRRDDVTALEVQHRSVPAIGSLVSSFAYDGRVKPDRKATDAKPLSLNGIGSIKPINFVGFTTETLDDLYGLDTVDGSALHLYSVIFTYNFAEFISKEIQRQYPDSEYSIGVVCPYRSEANVIRQMLENRSIDNENCKVTCGTVHSFQGDQCDIMLVVLNPPLECTKGTHINNGNIINVAMSRARDYVFFIIPDSPIDGFRTRELLWSLADPNSMSLFSCANLEKIIFGKSDFISRNTNVTSHMPVNVYYEPARLYDIKIDETAVDVQINEDLRG